MTIRATELHTLVPAQIAAYLRSAGWLPTDRKEASVKWRLARADQRPRSVVLVTDPEDPDYEDYLTVLFSRLLDIEERDEDAILRDLIDAGRDTLVVRVSAPNIASGEIPVSYGEELFGGVRDLIVAGGRAVKISRGFFAGPPPEDVMEILKKLTFGQTRAGSYELTVKTPVEQQLVFPFEESDDRAAAAGVSFERRALARTLEAVAAVREAAAHPEDEDAVDVSIEHGVSAQLCRALARIDPELAGVNVDIRGEWAPGLPAPTKEPPPSVSLRREDLIHVRALGETLGRLTPEEDYSLSGWIKQVTAKGYWDPQGLVVVETRVAGRSRDVRLVLGDDLWEEASRLVGHGLLRARGTLEKAGRAWVLTDPRNIQISEGTPPKTDEH